MMKAKVIAADGAVSTFPGRKDITESFKRKLLNDNAKRLYGWNS